MPNKILLVYPEQTLFVHSHKTVEVGLFLTVDNGSSVHFLGREAPRSWDGPGLLSPYEKIHRLPPVDRRRQKAGNSSFMPSCEV